MHLHFREHKTRMRSGQTQHGDHNHDAVQANKVTLILHDGVPPAVSHFPDTEDAPGDDGQVRKHERGDKELKAAAREQLRGRMRQLPAALVQPHGIIRDQAAEDQKRKDLPHDTGHHKIVARILQGATMVGRGGEAPPRALEHKREEVAEDKDPGVEARLEAGEGGAGFEDDVLEGEINAGGNEGGSDDEAANLDVKGDLGVGVCVEHYAAHVAWKKFRLALRFYVLTPNGKGSVQFTETFSDTAPDQCSHERPCSPSDAEAELKESADAEEGAEEGVGAEGRVEAVDGEFDGAVDADAGAVICREVCRRKHGRLGWVSRHG